MNAKQAKKSKGTQTFNIPNTPEGLQLLDDLKKHLHHSEYRIHSRGRGSRPDRSYQSHIPIAMSEWIAVYIHPKQDNRDREETARIINEFATKANEARSKAKIYEYNNKRLKDENEALRLTIEALRVKCNRIETAPAPASIPVAQAHAVKLDGKGKEIVLRISVE